MAILTCTQSDSHTMYKSITCIEIKLAEGDTSVAFQDELKQEIKPTQLLGPHSAGDTETM